MGLLKYNKVYVLAPYHYVSGGPELAHQLVDYLRSNGKEAYIVYVNKGKLIKNDLSVTNGFEKYNVKVTDYIEFNTNNVVVIPESFLYFIPQFENIQVCIWWMSVDFAIKGNSNLWENFRFKRGLDKLRVIKHYKEYENRYSLTKLKKVDYRLTHFYQATYIQQFLYKLGLNRIVRLSDYINADIINNVNHSITKRNIILYNPKKGLKYTKRLIKIMPDYKFIALKGYNRQQLNTLFDESKVYIDFGNFPGKDRLPREAAIHNCCLITGRFGASGYFEDLPIDSKYKFIMDHANFQKIRSSIIDIFDNYEERSKDFEYLRSTIIHEQEHFYSEVENIFF